METASLQLPRDLIEAAINQQVQIAMATAFGQSDRLIQECVSAILTQKVGDDGKPSSYSSSTTFVQWAVRDCLKKAVIDAITEQMAVHSDAIKEAIAKQLVNSRSPIVKNLAASLVDGMSKAVASRYMFTLEIKGDS